MQPSTGPFNDGVNDGDGEYVLLDRGGRYSAVAIQTINGVERIVAGGFEDDGQSVVRPLVARYDPSGNLDPSFDGDGIATLDLSGHRAFGNSLVIQSDGKVVLAGTINSRGGSLQYDDLLVARLTPAGTLDSTFGGGDGWVQFDVRKTWDHVASVGLQATGKIAVAGFTYSSMGDNSLLARFRANGTLDSGPGGFGQPDRKGVSPGYTITDVSPRSTDGVRSMLVRPDGRLVVGGYAYMPDFRTFLAQYTPDGVLDRTFNPTGPQPGFVFVQDVGLPGSGSGRVCALQPDGKIIFAGSQGAYGNELLVARFHANGTLDVSFGGGKGYVLTNGYGPASVVIQPDGKLVVAGRVHDPQANRENAMVVRLNPDGTLDTAFGSNGYKFGHPLPSSSMNLNGLARLSDGSLYVVGTAYPGGQVIPWIMRFTSDGGGLGAPQLAADGQGPGGAGVFAITSDQVAALLPAAIDRWADTGLSEADLARLHAVSVQVVDLPPGRLGAAPLFGGVISIDIDAAGYGWYIDATPWGDAAFTVPTAFGLGAATGSPAFGRMDLLTVVMHELGHVLGRDSVFGGDPSDLMAAYLGTGVRRLPTAAVAAEIPSAESETEPTRHMQWQSVDDEAVDWLWDAGPQRRNSWFAGWPTDA